MADDADNNGVKTRTEFDISRIHDKLYGKRKEFSLLKEAYNRVFGHSPSQQTKISQINSCPSLPLFEKRKKNGCTSKKRMSRPCKSDGAADSIRYCHSTSEMVLVSGYSGTGKSYLMDKLKKEATHSSTCCGGTYFVSGQFDQQQNYRPYPAVSEVLDSLCNIIFCSKDDSSTTTLSNHHDNNNIEWTEIGLAVKKDLGIEALRKLIPIIPKLRLVIPPCDDDRQKEQQMTTQDLTIRPSSLCFQSISESRSSFLFTLHSFIQSVCSNCSALVWLLHDLHWADLESIILIKTLLMDEQTKNLLFVGSYCEEDIAPDSVIAKSVQDIKERGATNVTEIQLGNLDEGSTNALILDLLQCNDDEGKTFSLAKCIHKQTKGNILFSLQSLEALRDEGLLWFSLESNEWQWADDDKIQSSMKILNNADDLIAKKIQRSPNILQVLLMIASCLEFQFDADLLEFIIDSWQQKCDDDERELLHVKSSSCNIERILRTQKIMSMEALLEMAVERGFLDEVNGVKDNKMYKFSYDNIQQLSYSLLPGGKELEIVHLKIGNILLKKLSSSTDESNNREDNNNWILFIVVYQFSQCSSDILDKEKKIELARLIFKVAKIAAASSAFEPTAKYLRNAIVLLDESNSWIDHYDLMWNVHTLSVAMEMCTGNTDRCSSLIKTVLKNAKSLEDKIPVYFVQMELLISRGVQLNEAMNVGFDLLSMMGEKNLKKIFRGNMLNELFRTKSVLGKLTEADLIALPAMTNEKKLLEAEVIGFLFGCSAMGRSKHCSLLAIRLIQLIVKYGHCSYSPIATSMYGAYLCGPQGDIGSGICFGRITMSLLKRTDPKWHSLATFFTYTFINPWVEHLQKSLDPLLNAYKIGMRSGAVFGAMFCAVSYCDTYIMTGMPLAPIERDMRLYYQLMVEYDQATPKHFLLPIWQFVLNLIGQSESEDPLILTGEAMDQSSLITFAKQNKNYAIIERVYAAQIELAYIFDDMNLAANLMSLALHDINKSLFSPNFVRWRCIRGLVALTLARRTGKRKWLKRSLKTMKQVKYWVKCNAGNILHLHLLMEAEYDTLNKKEETVKKSFDRAITTASRSGFLQDQAIANERAGIFFLEIGDEFWASYYLTQAQMLYADWGAHAKVDSMRGKHASLLRKAKEHDKMLGHRGVSRFSDASKSHKKITFEKVLVSKNGTNAAKRWHTRPSK